MRRLVALSGLVLLGLLSCLALSLVLAILVPGLGDSGDDPETPEEAVRRVACVGPIPAMDFHVREVRRVGAELAVLYDARCPASEGGGGARFAAASIAGERPTRTLTIGGRVVWEERYWSATPAGSLALGVAPSDVGLSAEARGPFIAYEGGTGSGWSRGVGNYDYVSGRVIEPTRVAAVEAVLSNGDTVRGDVTRGVWVLFALESRIREVRALDRDGRVIQRIDMEFDM